MEIILIEKDKEHIIITIGRLKIRLGLYRLLKRRQKAIVILEQGGFGDYICCRPFFKYLKEKFSEYSIIYVCQDWTAKFSEIYDKGVIDKVLGFNRSEFKSDNLYRKNLLKYINSNYSVQKYIHLPHFLVGISKQQSWRMYFAKKIKAKEKYVGVIKYSEKKNKQFQVFNKKIEIEPYKFCVDRNRIFFEKILGIKIDKYNKNINLPMLSENRKDVVISIGASDDIKMYSIEKWIKVLDFITENTSKNSKIIFIGTCQERHLIEKIFNEVKDNSKYVNLAGELDISALPFILQRAKFMISMESGNTHLAHVVDCPTLCLCGGYYYNGAQPYKNSSVKYLYPPKFYEILEKNDEKLLKKIYFSCEELRVKDIEPETVISELNKFYLSSPVK